MKANSHDLSIRWKTIHELTRFTETRIKQVDNKLVEIFEPRPFDTVIQPRLINQSDLEIPRQWLFSDLVEDNKRITAPISSLQASGKNLYIQNHRKSESHSAFERDFPKKEFGESGRQNSIDIKNVQFPILPRTNFQNDEINSASIYHFQTKIGRAHV